MHLSICSEATDGRGSCQFLPAPVSSDQFQSVLFSSSKFLHIFSVQSRDMQWGRWRRDTALSVRRSEAQAWRPAPVASGEARCLSSASSWPGRRYTPCGHLCLSRVGSLPQGRRCRPQWRPIGALGRLPCRSRQALVTRSSPLKIRRHW